MPIQRTCLARRLTRRNAPSIFAFLLSGVYVGRRSNSMRMRRHRRHRRRRHGRRTEQQLSPYCFLLACYYDHAKLVTDLGSSTRRVRDFDARNLRRKPKARISD